jgi:RNA polymerase sigma factor for flagellar operon FliA
MMTEEARIKLFEEYSKKPTAEIREKLIIEYANLVKIVSGRMSVHLGHNVDYEDLVSYGTLGLIDAIDKFDVSKEIKFETYASLRIRGAILDQIRKMDWVPRTLRQKQRSIEAAYRKVESETGRMATDSEIAEELGVSTEELDKWQSQAVAANVVSLDEYMETGDVGAEPISHDAFDSPERSMELQDLKRLLMEALTHLTEKEKSVIILYYYEELTLKEISAILKVSESRISQLHTKALSKMRQTLGPDISVFWGR